MFPANAKRKMKAPDTQMNPNFAVNRNPYRFRSWLRGGCLYQPRLPLSFLTWLVRTPTTNEFYFTIRAFVASPSLLLLSLEYS